MLPSRHLLQFPFIGAKHALNPGNQSLGMPMLIKDDPQLSLCLQRSLCDSIKWRSIKLSAAVQGSLLPGPRLPISVISILKVHGIGQ